MRVSFLLHAFALLAGSPEARPNRAKSESPDTDPVRPEPWEEPSVTAEAQAHHARTRLPTHGPSPKTLRRRAKKAAAARR